LLLWKRNNGSTNISVDPHVTVNNTNVATEMQQWEKFGLLSSYKIFFTAFNNIKVRVSACKVEDNLTTPEVSGQISTSLQYQFQETPSSEQTRRS